MEEYVKRDTYLNRLIVRRDNNLIKAVTGPRRAGKSFLLNPIFKDYLLGQGIPEDHIISISFDIEDEETPQELLDREKLKEFLYSRITSETEPYYVFLDEIQEVDGFERIVNGLNKRPNVDVYITGSNSKFLSTDTKREQELKPLKRIDDSFQKIVIVKDDIMPYRDEKGIYYTGLFQFLTSEKVID